MRQNTVRLTTAASAVIAALLLASCGGGSGGDASPADAETVTDATTEPTAEPTESDEPAATVLATNYAAEMVDFGEPGATVEPGSQLGFGTPAWVNQTETFGEEEITGGAGVSVLGVQPLEPTLFDKFNNAEEFAGFTPYAVIYQVQWLYDTPGDYSPQAPALFPIKEDGSDANYLTSGIVTTMFSSPGDDCGLQLPPYDEATRTLVTCFVALSEDLPVVGAQFNGEDYGAFFATDGNPYVSSPVTWR